MRFQEERPAGHRIRAHGEQGLLIGETWYRDSLLVAADYLDPHWPARQIADLGLDHLQAILTHAPEVLLLGTGATSTFPSPAILAPLYAARIGVDVMATPSACRTYNLLLAEGRRVMAALVLPGE